MIIHSTPPCYDHGLKSGNWYWYQSMVFSVNIVNISYQYRPHWPVSDIG